MEDDVCNIGRRGREERRRLLESVVLLLVFSHLTPITERRIRIRCLAIGILSYWMSLRAQLRLLSSRISLESVSSNDCRDLFRFNKEDIPMIVSSLEMPNIMRCQNGSVFSSIEGFMILTYNLAYPKRLVEMKNLFQRSEDDMSRIFNFLLLWLNERWIHLLDGRNICITPQSVNTYRAALASCTQMNQFPVFGFIDGTLRPCARPVVFQRSIYNGMDRVHGLKFLVVQTADGMVPILTGPHEGAHHDSWCYQHSNIENTLDRRIGSHLSLALYGDQGFSNSGWVLTAYRGNHLTPSQIEWNRKANSCRVCVEWGIGKIATLWASLNYKE